MNYGSYQITCIEEEKFGDYDKRFFHLIQVSAIKRFKRSSIARG